MPRQARAGAGRSLCGGLPGARSADLFEAAVRRRLAEDDEVLKLATAVLYGSDGDSGASSLVSGRHADVVFNRYVRPHTWNKAAAICNVAPATARRMASELFDIVDAYGIERAIEGAGIA